MVRGRVAAPPRLPRGYSAEVRQHGTVAAAARTRIVVAAASTRPDDAARAPPSMNTISLTLLANRSGRACNAFRSAVGSPMDAIVTDALGWFSNIAAYASTSPGTSDAVAAGAGQLDSMDEAYLRYTSGPSDAIPARARALVLRLLSVIRRAPGPRVRAQRRVSAVIVNDRVGAADAFDKTYTARGVDGSTRRFSARPGGTRVVDDAHELALSEVREMRRDGQRARVVDVEAQVRIDDEAHGRGRGRGGHGEDELLPLHRGSGFFAKPPASSAKETTTRRQRRSATLGRSPFCGWGAARGCTQGQALLGHS